MDFFRRLLAQVRQVWQGMAPGGRVVFALTALLALAVVGGSYYFSTQSEYRLLYGGLTEEDAAAVTAKLQSLGVTYRLGPNGTSVYVPADRYAQLRLDLAADGVVNRSGKGFELFDEAQLGQTPFTQQVNYLRALQSELARTISQIEPVAAARVHIVRQEPSPFVREQKPTTASVVLRLRPGGNLARGTAHGIVALVARAVEGLSPENVTLLDANGRVLSQPQSSDAGAVANQLEYRRALETYLASKAEEMLGQLLGPGRSVVRVTADINFQRLRERKETYQPEGRVITSEKVTSNSTTSSSPGGRGPAGTASNLPVRQTGGAAGLGGGTGGGNNSREETTETEYAVSKVTQEFEDKLGTIERLTVAGLVDLAKREGESGAGLNLADVEEIIKRAVGYKTERDEIKVNDVRLAGAVAAPPPEDTGQERLEQMQYVVTLVRNGSLAVAALVALLLGLLLLRRPKPAPSPVAATDPRMERILNAIRRDPQGVARLVEALVRRSA